MGKHGKKVTWGWGMVVVGYTEIGNVGHNVHRMVTWHLRAVEGYGGGWSGNRRGVPWGRDGKVMQVGKRSCHDDGGSTFVPVAFKTLGHFNNFPGLCLVMYATIM
jgi:hypothetical protein